MLVKEVRERESGEEEEGCVWVIGEGCGCVSARGGEGGGGGGGGGEEGRGSMKLSFRCPLNCSTMIGYQVMSCVTTIREGKLSVLMDIHIGGCVWPLELPCLLYTLGLG